MITKKHVALFFILMGTAICADARHNEGVHLAAEIIGLVRTAITPAPRVVVQPAPQVVVQPAPQVVVQPTPQVVVQPTPQVVIPEYSYDWWHGAWVPRWGDWYWHHNAWVWGGRGPRPIPPRWAPDFRRRPPPPPRHYHRPAPPRHYHRPAPPRHQNRW